MAKNEWGQVKTVEPYERRKLRIRTTYMSLTLVKARGSVKEVKRSRVSLRGRGHFMIVEACKRQSKEIGKTM